MFCKSCGKEVSANINTCPQCGEKIAEDSNKKKNLTIIVVVCCLLLAVLVATLGISSKKSSDVSRVADSDEFLSDMAAGITERLATDDSVDESAMTATEKKEYRAKLVNCELEKIAKYENMSFKDEKLDDFAHTYINACKSQLFALEYFANEELYSALWNGGRTIRAGIIVELYKNYALPISEEHADSYKSTENVNVSVNVDSDFNIDDYMHKDKEDVVLNQGELFIVSGECYFEGDYLKYSFNVKNNSKHNLTSIGIVSSLCDSEDNVIGTDSAYLHVSLPAGKSGKVEGTIKKDELSNVSYVKVDSFNYDGNGNNIVFVLYPDKENAENTKIMIP